MQPPAGLWMIWEREAVTDYNCHEYGWLKFCAKANLVERSFTGRLLTKNPKINNNTTISFSFEKAAN
jgi:hypothetical protein